MRRNTPFLPVLLGTVFCSLAAAHAQSAADMLPAPSMVLELAISEPDTGRVVSRPRMQLIDSYTATIETDATFADTRVRMAWSVTAEFEDENVCVTVVYEDLHAEEFCGATDDFQFQTTLELGDVGDMTLRGESIEMLE